MKYIVIVILLLILCAVIFFLLRPGVTKRDHAEKARQGLTSPQLSNSYYVKGALVVGFKKGVTQARAEEILKNYSIKYERTNDVNMGKRFYYETGEKFLVIVPEGEEQIRLEKFRKMQEVKAAGHYPDPDKILVD